MNASENRNPETPSRSPAPENDASSLFAAESAAAECPHCFGSGMEVIPGEGARRCRCQITSEVERLLQVARIPPRYKQCTIANFDPGDSEQASGRLVSNRSGLSKWMAKREAQVLVDEFLSLDGRGLLFVGQVGVGKTHLAVAILVELIKRYHVRGVFYQFGALLKEIRDSYNSISQTSELNLLTPVLQADVLVLDELGSQKATDWVSDTLMYIINSRYNEKRTTILTSNYGDVGNTETRIGNLSNQRRQLDYMVNASIQQKELIEEQKLLYEGSLEERIGGPLRSRLYEMCKTVVIEGDDYRKRSTTEKV